MMNDLGLSQKCVRQPMDCMANTLPSIWCIDSVTPFHVIAPVFLRMNALHDLHRWKASIPLGLRGLSRALSSTGVCRLHKSLTRHRCHNCKGVVALACGHGASWDDAWLSPFGHAHVHPRHTGGTTHPYCEVVILLIFDAGKDDVANAVAPFGPDGARNNNATNMGWTTRCRRHRCPPQTPADAGES